MKTIQIDDSYFCGVSSIERLGEGWKPWRLPHLKQHLFPAPNDMLMFSSSCTTGVRLRFQTDSKCVGLNFAPLGEPHSALDSGHWFDIVIENRIVGVKDCGKDATSVMFENLPDGENVVEIWLPPSCSVVCAELLVDDQATAKPLPDRRPMWITWGSSLTHCVRAGSAARTWPASVARKHDLNLMNFGFGGQCHLDPMVAMAIRDLPADYISLKLGINALIATSVNARTYPALIVGAVKIIREKHPHTPMALISPIGYPPLEAKENVVGYSAEAMRRDMKRVCDDLIEAGDRNLYYVDGLELFDADDIIAHAKDQCHPYAEGIDIKAERFSKIVMPLLTGKTS